MSKISATGRITAVCAAAVLLTGCGANNSVPDQNSGGDLHDMIEVQEARETDISKRYPEYFKYCFGEDAKFELLDTDEEQNDHYHLTFHDHTGAERTVNTYIHPYAAEDDKETFPTEQDYYNYQIDELAHCALGEVFENEFDELLLNKRFTVTKTFDNISLEYDGAHISLSGVNIIGVRQTFYLPPDDEVGQRLAMAHIQPQTGWQACTADMKSIAASDEWYCLCVITIDEDADAAAWTEKAKGLCEAYETCIGAPQNYAFHLQQYKKESTDSYSTQLWHKTVILGQEIDTEKEREKNKDFFAMQYLAKKLIEKHKND